MIELVDSRPALERACADLGAASTLYLDTEFESGPGRSELCLVQLSAGNTVYLIDTLRLPSLEPLARLLGEKEREWVLHAGDQDLPLLVQRLRIALPERLFDTRVAWALISPEASVSLAYLLYRVLGLRTRKTHQADDWRHRPLPRAQLEYAAADVRHLPALHAGLVERLGALGRQSLVHRVSREQLEPEVEPPSQLELDSFRNAWQLDAPGQAALVYLIEWYSGLSAEERSLAPEPKTLFSIASRLPTSVAELGRIKGVSRRWCEQYGVDLVGKLRVLAREAQARDWPLLEPAPYATFHQYRVEAWLFGMRAEVCARLRVAPELVLPNRWLRRTAQRLERGLDPTALGAELGGWRRELLEPVILEYVAERPLPTETK